MDPAVKFLADEALPITGFGKGLYQTAGSSAASRFADIFSGIVTIFTIFGGLAFLFWFVMGALSWATSGGNPEQTNRAKSQMSTAVAGLFILIISTAIVWILGRVTGLDMLNVEKLLKAVTP